jgi:hypothetical protein
MISIQSSLTELERSHQIRAAVLDWHVLAIKNTAHYAVELLGVDYPGMEIIVSESSFDVLPGTNKVNIGREKFLN